MYRGELTDVDVRIYGLIAAGRNVPAEHAESVRKLAALGYVVTGRPGQNRPVALDPKDVARRQLESELRQAADRVAKLMSLPRQMDLLSTQYERVQWRASGGSEYIEDAGIVNARLDDVVGAAECEILAAQPGGPRDDVQLARSLERDSEALDRGVAKRTLYLDTVRDNPVTGEYARTMATRPAGRCAEFRTLVEPFERAIIVDRRVAFISNHLVKGAPAHSAWQITDRAMVSYIVAEFEARWRRADPWHGEHRVRAHPAEGMAGAGGVRTTPRQREILRDMIAGRPQQATASRLGISLRTLSGEISELKSLFDARAVAELVYKWALSPDRLVDDSAEDGHRGEEDGADLAPSAAA